MYSFVSQFSSDSNYLKYGRLIWNLGWLRLKCFQGWFGSIQSCYTAERSAIMENDCMNSTVHSIIGAEMLIFLKCVDFLQRWAILDFRRLYHLYCRFDYSLCQLWWEIYLRNMIKKTWYLWSNTRSDASKKKNSFKVFLQFSKRLQREKLRKVYFDMDLLVHLGSFVGRSPTDSSDYVHLDQHFKVENFSCFISLDIFNGNHK